MGVPFENSQIKRRNVLAKCAAAEKHWLASERSPAPRQSFPLQGGG